jgi:hypothetical protein
MGAGPDRRFPGRRDQPFNMVTINESAMNSCRYPLPTPARPAERQPADRGGRTAVLQARFVIVTLLVILAGCATPQRAPDPRPPVYIPGSTWQQVDRDIVAASTAARRPAGNYARGAMKAWLASVRQRTEADFIPWYTGYWTQQWLAIKVAWYKMSAGQEEDPAVERLAAYLQEQYQEQVLGPVAREIDPDAVRGQATKLYVQLLGEQVQGIQRRYDVPLDQFDRRLKDIPAIVLPPPAAQRASLYQTVHALPISELPAYAALLARIRKDAGGAGAGPSNARISPVAKRASEKLVARLAASGGASAAAAAVGGVAGAVISLGAAGIGAMTHEKERPEMEAQLRESLNAALGDMWRSLMEDPATGVMAAVDHIATQVEGSLIRTVVRPVVLEPVPQDLPLPGEPPRHGEDEEVQGEDEQDGDETLSDDDGSLEE